MTKIVNFAYELSACYQHDNRIYVLTLRKCEQSSIAKYVKKSNLEITQEIVLVLKYKNTYCVALLKLDESSYCQFYKVVYFKEYFLLGDALQAFNAQINKIITIQELAEENEVKHA